MLVLHFIQEHELNQVLFAVIGGGDDIWLIVLPLKSAVDSDILELNVPLPANAII